MGRRKTNEEFVKEVYELVGDEYVFLDEYKGSSVKIRYIHNKCGKENSVIPNNFLNGSRCPNCNKYRNTRKTNEEFVKEVYDLVGDEYTFLEEYTTTNNSILCRHNKCGHEFKVAPINFLKRNTRCPKHRYKTQKKTTEFFRQEVAELGEGDYLLESEYISDSKKVTFKHLTCGKEFTMTPNAFIRGQRCIHCRKNHRKTNEEFTKEVHGLVGNEYTFTEEYSGALNKIEVKHNKCGKTYSVTPSNFLNGGRCPYCKGRNRTTEDFKNIIHSMHGEEYTVLGEYKNVRAKIKMRHNKCGTEYSSKVADILSGSECPKCNGNMKPTTDMFIKRISKLYGNRYEILSEYINSYTKIKVKDNYCKHEFYIVPSMLVEGYGCNKCKESIGERLVRTTLDNNNIKYIKEKVFKELPRKRFDFYLPEYNTIIEFDGAQHFKPSEFFGGGEAFERIRKSDCIKNKFAKDMGIDMLRISYEDINEVNEIIERKLKLK